jgi:hypothetical protein
MTASEPQTFPWYIDDDDGGKFFFFPDSSDGEASLLNEDYWMVK